MTVRDVGRRRATWTTTLVTGLLAAVLLVASSVISERVRQRVEQFSYLVAVDGDVDGAQEFLALLETEKLRFEQSSDARAQVTSQQAAAGLTLPDALDARLASGEPVDVDTYHRRQHDSSVSALVALLLQIQEAQTSLLRSQIDAAGLEAPPGPVIDEREISLDPSTNRATLAPVVAALAALLCFGVISSAAAAAGGRRDDRSVEAVLALPLGRLPLATGLSLGIMPVAVVQLVVAIVVIVMAMILPISGLNQSGGAVLAMLAGAVPAAVCLGALASSVGVLAGLLGAGSDDAVSLGDLASVAFVGVAALFFVAPDTVDGPLAWFAPIVGPVAMLRDAITGAAQPAQVLATLASTVGWTACTIAVASRVLGDERRVLRVG